MLVGFIQPARAPSASPAPAPPHLLQAVYLARGGDDWQPEAAATALSLLPSLKRLQIRFSLGEDEGPEQLLSLLLPPPPPPLSDAQEVAGSLPALCHLALIYPVRSMMPPTQPLPCTMSMLTGVGSAAAAATSVLATRPLPSWISPLYTQARLRLACARTSPALLQLTSLKMKRTPMASVPSWLGELTQLRFLLWDPALPADIECE